MNPAKTPTLVYTAGGDHAPFMEIYPVARRVVSVRSANALPAAYTAAFDRQDLEQEAILAVYKAFPRYDPTRGSVRTFVEQVAAARIASVLRTLHRQRRLENIEMCQCVAPDNISAVELRGDLRRASASLSQGDRELAGRLMEHSPTEAARRLDVARATVYAGIRRIRVALTAAGLGPSLRPPR